MSGHYVYEGLGTFGASSKKGEARQALLYGRAPLPGGVLDSDGSDLLPPSAWPEPTVPRLDVSLDVEDLRRALEQGLFPKLAFLDRRALAATRARGAFGLYPGLGNASGTLNQGELRDLQRRHFQVATHHAVPNDGPLVWCRAYSCLGGTSRALAFESSEAGYDIARNAGLRVTQVDVVALPGLEASASRFESQYLRNTFAFIVEESARRCEEFARLAWDDRGAARGEVRTAILPHTLVLVTDSGADDHSVSVVDLSLEVARFTDLLSQPEFSRRFWGRHADLITHGTKEPHAARMGVYTIYQPAREATQVRRLRVLGRCLERSLTVPPPDPEAARTRLGHLGLWADDTLTLRVMAELKERLLRPFHEDPASRLRGFTTASPADLFDEYLALVETLHSVDADAVGREVAELKEKGGALEDTLTHLRATVLPGPLLGAMRDLTAVAKEEAAELVQALDDVEERQIETEERGANAARDGFERLARRRFARNRALERDALAQVREHLVAALTARIHLRSLRAHSALLNALADDLTAGVMPVWDTLRREAEDLVEALRPAAAEPATRLALLTSGTWSHRGPAMALSGLGDPRWAAPDPDVGPLLGRFMPAIAALYGAAPDAVKREVDGTLWRSVCQAVPHVRAALDPKDVSDEALQMVFKRAQPLAPVDETLWQGRRARFVVAHGGEASPLRGRAQSVATATSRGDVEFWIDLGQDFADEVVVITYEEGVPLRAFKTIERARAVYREDPTRELGHLEPLYNWLPDPLEGTLPVDRLMLFGLASGALTRDQGRLRFSSPRLTGQVPDRTTLARYEVAVSLASQFIVSVRRNGFAAVLSTVAALASDPDAGSAVPWLTPELRRLAALYHQPLP